VSTSQRCLAPTGGIKGEFTDKNGDVWLHVKIESMMTLSVCASRHTGARTARRTGGQCDHIHSVLKQLEDKLKFQFSAATQAC
jgi:hypothetical protein